MKPTNTVLMINHMFPPFNGVGVIRIAKFVRYLPLFGWQPIVLTCKRPIQNQDAVDMGMLEELPENLEVHRVACPGLYELYRLCGGKIKQGSFGLSKGKSYDYINALSVPDPYFGWYFTGMHTVRRLFKRTDIQAVFTTSPRETAHLIGRTIKRKYGISWIADFRDPWLKKKMRPQKIGVLDQFERRLQKSVVEEADRLLIAWPGIAEEFHAPRAKVDVLTNGFDEKDFQGLEPFAFDRFTIIYAGSLFKELAPDPFFNALLFIKNVYPDIREKLQVILLGRQDGYVLDLIQRRKVNDLVKLWPQMPHRECLRYLMNADMLLVFAPDNFWIPSKIYEYLRVGRPVLAVMHSEADAIRLLKTTNAVFWPSLLPEEIAHIIIQNIRLHSESKRVCNLPALDDSIKCFERMCLTQKLASILDAEKSKVIK